MKNALNQADVIREVCSAKLVTDDYTVDLAPMAHVLTE